MTNGMPRKTKSASPLRVAANALLAHTLETRIVQKYDMAALVTSVPISMSNGGHDFELFAFDAIGATDDGCPTVH